mgnify:CR=1 FL=1
MSLDDEFNRIQLRDAKMILILKIKISTLSFQELR